MRVITIEDVIQDVVKRVQLSSRIQSVRDYLEGLGKETEGMPYYIDGHPQEINLRLTEKSKDSTTKYKRYPLIALRLDTTEEVYGRLHHFKLNIGIFAYTDKNYTSAQRKELVFKPILYPLYYEFLRQLKLSGWFTWPPTSLDVPKHTKVDRYFWGTGTENGNTKNIFSDPLDAIEILNLEVNLDMKKCKALLADQLFDDSFDLTFN